MKISYAITVCNEFLEIQRLIPFLIINKRDQDEIVVLVDLTKNEPTSDLLGYLHDLSSDDYITLVEDNFNGHFAEWKNRLTRACKGDYIFFLDADEFPNENLIFTLPEIIKENPDVEVYLVPRINTVDNIGLSHVKYKWKWNVSKLNSMVNEKEFDLDNPRDKDEYDLLKEYNLIIEENTFSR